MASVLVIAADPNIESLVGELVAFAGHKPVYDVTAGAAGEAVRRVRPEVTMLDTSLAPAVVHACLGAAHEVGSRAVLMSSTASASELLEEARAEGCLYFPLPGGPKPLACILDRAVQERPEPTVTALPKRRRAERVGGSVHPALRAALTGVARARALAIQAEAIRRDGGETSGAIHRAVSETERSRTTLRAAVSDYTKQLKAVDLPLDETWTVVRDAITECALVVGAEAAMPALLLESEEWTRQAYRAA